MLKSLIWSMTQINLVPKIQYFTVEQVENIVAQHFEIVETVVLDGKFQDLNIVARK